MFEPKINSQDQTKKQSEIETGRSGADEQIKNAFEIQSAFVRQSEIKTEVLPPKKTVETEMRTIEPIKGISEKSIWRRVTFLATTAFCGLILFFGSALLAFFVSPMLFQTQVLMFGGGGSQVEGKVEDEFGAAGNAVFSEEENYPETSIAPKETENVFDRSKVTGGEKSPNKKRSVSIFSGPEVKTERSERFFSFKKSQPEELKKTSQKTETDALDQNSARIPDKLPADAKNPSVRNYLKSQTNSGERSTSKSSPTSLDQTKTSKVSTGDRPAHIRQSKIRKKRQTTRNKRFSDKRMKRVQKNRQRQTQKIFKRSRRPDQN